MGEFKKISKMVLLLLIASVAAALTACRMHHFSRSEMNDYLKEQIPNKEFVMSKNYTEHEGSDHNIDRVWEVYLKDNPDLVFKVMSDKHSEGEFGDFNLKNNLSYVYGFHFYDIFCKTKQTNIKWYAGESSEKNDYFNWKGRLYISFTNRYELKQAVEELKEFYTFVNSQGYPIDLPFTIEYLSSTVKLENYSMLDSEYNADKFSSSTLEEATKMYAQFLVDHRLDNMKEFTKEEIIQYTSLSNEQFELTTVDGKKVKYNDMLLSKSGYGMSFGSIYEVLVRNGFKVNGDPKQFSFVGIDGNQYEFSYGFHDYPYEQADGEIKKGYYYLKNGQKKVLSNYFYNHIRSDLLKEISGISFERLKTK